MTENTELEKAAEKFICDCHIDMPILGESRLSRILQDFAQEWQQSQQQVAHIELQEAAEKHVLQYAGKDSFTYDFYIKLFKDGAEWKESQQQVIGEALKEFDKWIKKSDYRYQRQVTTKNSKNELVECQIGLWYKPAQSVGGKSLVQLYAEFTNNINP